LGSRAYRERERREMEMERKMKSEEKKATGGEVGGEEGGVGVTKTTSVIMERSEVGTASKA
jgi:hypothetical protein